MDLTQQQHLDVASEQLLTLNRIAASVLVSDKTEALRKDLTATQEALAELQDCRDGLDILKLQFAVRDLQERGHRVGDVRVRGEDLVAVFDPAAPNAESAVIELFFPISSLSMGHVPQTRGAVCISRNGLIGRK